jgi:hypothetical protein
MKNKLTFLFIFFLFINISGDLYGQMVYMPDSLLRHELTGLGYGTCITGDSINSICQPVNSATSINLINPDIRSLKGIEAFVSLQELICTSINVLHISELPLSLTDLRCTNSDSLRIDTLPKALKYLDLTQCNLSTLPSFPDSLVTIKCGFNNLTTLPTLSLTLKTLECYENLLTSLPTLPSTLKVLNVNSNDISSINTIPSGLEVLNCNKNQLYNLPVLSDSLRFLDVSYNQISILPLLPQYLKSLTCNDNLIQDLPVLPLGLETLICSTNDLDSLPTLPPGLKMLNATSNNLTTLPILPQTLTVLHCANNHIPVLPNLPDSLNDLFCSMNPLTQLPILPKGLLNLRSSNCLLQSLPELPDTLEFLFLDDNPTLYCLPRLKKIHWLKFTGCSITCVPNYGNVGTSQPALNTVPVCELFNSNSCSFYWNLSGRVYVDADTNCQYTTGDYPLRNQRVLLYRANNLVQQTFSDMNGNYFFDTDTPGYYTTVFDTISNYFSLYCPVPGIYTDTINPIDSIVFDNDFAIKCDTGFDLTVLSVVANRNIRPGRTVTVTVTAGELSALLGHSCSPGLSATLTIVMNGTVHYVSPSPGALVPIHVNGDTIVYFVPDVSQINPLTTFRFEVFIDTFAVANSKICFVINIGPLVGDVNQQNNGVKICFDVLNSFDPNDKQVYPSGVVDTSEMWFTYTIRFQNTGNAEAEHIYVLDTLDNNFDVSTFQLLTTSHPSLVQVLENGILRFNFPNINLPDSNSNEPLSHGYIQYKIKRIENLPIGTQFKNTAYIFFDFNAPVVTNTVLSEINVLTGIKSHDGEIEVQVWPVPFQNYFVIKTHSKISENHFTLFNLVGEIVHNGTIFNNYQVIHTGKLSRGIYILHIESDQGRIVKKLIKD